MGGIRSNKRCARDEAPVHTFCSLVLPGTVPKVKSHLPIPPLFPLPKTGRGEIIKKLMDAGVKAPASISFLTVYPSPVYGGGAGGGGVRCLMNCYVIFSIYFSDQIRSARMIGSPRWLSRLTRPSTTYGPGVANAALDLRYTSAVITTSSMPSRSSNDIK
jgi:hypothetical protein